jgi:hypothetical protein
VKRYRVQAPMVTLLGKSSPMAEFDTPKEAHDFARAREKNGYANTQIVDYEAKKVFTVAEFAAQHRLS